tara:strand:+ start:157 stop:315 length:159 start_codon:yes stop_codon:yes gene_type:complete
MKDFNILLRKYQLKVYNNIVDKLEQRLAGVIATKQKLAEQIERDKCIDEIYK